MHSRKSVLIPAPTEYRIGQRTFICVLVDVCLIMTEFEELGKECDRHSKNLDFIAAGFFIGEGKNYFWGVLVCGSDN